MSQELISTERSLPLVQSQETLWGGRPTRQLFFILLKWKWLILGLGLGFAAATAIMVWRNPPQYDASAKILFKEDRIPLQIAGLVSKSRSVDFKQAVRAEVELITGWNVIFPVAQELIAQRNKERKQSETAAEMEAAAERKAYILMKRTSAVVLPGTTNIIKITYSANAPEKAVRNLGMILKEYMKQHSIVRSGSSKLLDLYTQEAERVRSALQEAEDRLRVWKRDHDIVSIEDQTQRLLGMLIDQREKLQRVDADLAGGRGPNPLTKKLENDLLIAEVELHELLQRYTDEDRRVQEKRDQITFLKEELLRAERTAENAFRSSLIAQQKVLQRQIDETSAALNALRESKPEFARLTREVGMRQDAFQFYGKRLEETRIAAQLEQAELSNVAVIEQPRASQGDGSQQKNRMVFLSGLAGIGMGLIFAFGFEFFRNTFHTPQDVEAYLGLPVLAAIPDLRSRYE